VLSQLIDKMRQTHIHHFRGKPLWPGGSKHLDKTRDSHEDLDQENHRFPTEFVGWPGTSEKHQDVADGISGLYQL
jgi:hypothetical protein